MSDMDRNAASTTENHQRAAELFERVWSSDSYAGFSHGTTGAHATPFLDAFIAQVKRLGAARPRVAELGAGSGDHARRLHAEGFDVTAVEASEAAVRFMTDRTISAGGGLRVLQMDLLEYARGVSPGSLDALYANSVLHFLSPGERAELYGRLAGAFGGEGVIGVSFKAQGDALQERGSVVQETAAGAIVEDAADRVRRLFVRDPAPLVEELRAAGFREIGVVSWSVPSYNIEGRDGRFVGILADRG